MKEGPINRDPIFLEIGTKSNRNSGSPKQGPNNAHLVEYLNMGTLLIQIKTHRGAMRNDNQWNLKNIARIANAVQCHN